MLTEKAAKVFRFEEQNQLHEEIIDTGLAQIYQSHLEVAERMAKDEGVEVVKTLLDGKAFQKVLDHVRKTNPWLLVVGRIGVHSPATETGLGSNAENLLRACPCDILLTTRLEVPQLDVKAEESIRWTPEAEERMKRVPAAGEGDRAHRDPAPRGREGAPRDHERGDRRGDGALHAEVHLGRDDGAGRGGRARAREVAADLDVRQVRRHRDREPAGALRRLRRRRSSRRSRAR